MNKKLIAAIAATTMAGAIGFASIASAAEFNWYGSLRAGAVYSDNDTRGDDGSWDFGATGNDGNVGGQGLYSRIGIKASTDLGNGSSAGLRLERGVGSSALTTRHTNVWVKGGWGKLTFGQQDNPYRNARKWDQTWFLGGQYSFGDGGSRIEGLRYTSNFSGPFNFSVMATANDEALEVAAKTTTIHYYSKAPTSSTTSVLVVAADTGLNNVPLFLPVTDTGEFAPDRDACTVILATDGSRCAAAYTLGADIVEDTSGITNFARSTDPSTVTRVRIDKAAIESNSGVDSWIIATGYDFGAVKLDVARRFNQTDLGSDNTAIGLDGSVGSFGWYLVYQESDDNTDAKNDTDSWGGYVSLSVSDNNTLYAYHVSHDRDEATAALGTDVTESILGYSHSFGGGVSFIAEYLEIDKDLPSGTDGSDPSVLALALKVDF